MVGVATGYTLNDVITHHHHRLFCKALLSPPNPDRLHQQVDNHMVSYFVSAS